MTNSECLKATILRPINYARAASLVASVTGIVSKRGKVVADTSTNSLIIQDVDSRIAVDSAFVGQLDIETVVKASHALSSEMVLPGLIEKLMRHEDLSTEEAGAAMGEIMEGRAASALEGRRPAKALQIAQ